jgi:hypothetical protein
MIITNQIIIVGSPDDSDGYDDTGLEARSTSCSSLSGEASRRGSGQSDEGRPVKKEPNLENYQPARALVPYINTMGAGCLDPFQTLPNLAGGDTEELTHHCTY